MGEKEAETGLVSHDVSGTEGLTLRPDLSSPLHLQGYGDTRAWRLESLFRFPPAHTLRMGLCAFLLLFTFVWLPYLRVSCGLISAVLPHSGVWSALSPVCCGMQYIGSFPPCDI